MVSELALHVESKMIIFASGLLQGFTVGKEAEMIDVHHAKTKVLSRLFLR